jgi:hypothetical protein
MYVLLRQRTWRDLLGLDCSFDGVALSWCSLVINVSFVDKIVRLWFAFCERV